MGNFKKNGLMLLAVTAGYFFALLSINEARELNNKITLLPQAKGRSEACEMLKTFLQADMDALNNGAGRIDNVVYSVVNGKGIWQGVDVKPGYYDIDWDEFSVITKWEILQDKVIDHSTVECSVKLSVIGHANQRLPNKSITNIKMVLGNGVQEQIIYYQLKKVEEEWKVVDPPMPYIGLSALEIYYQEKIKTISNKIDLMRKKDLKPYPNLLKTYDETVTRMNDILVLKNKGSATVLKNQGLD